MKTHYIRIEALEVRIAPAIFFLNGTNLHITDSTGTDQAGDLVAAATVGATKAILIHAGDSVVFDLNGNHKVDAKTDFTMIKVTAGQALAFFTDLNTNAANGEVGKFNTDEFTGLAVGDGVKASINGRLRGSIDTVLDSTGHLTSVQQPSSIAGLKIAGNVDEFIEAGGNISNVSFAVPKGNNAEFDVLGIFTGNVTNDHPSFNGTTSFNTTFTQAAGTKGGSIFGIKLPRGSTQIAAGGGGDSATGDAGAGGDVINVSLTGTIVYGIYAGRGGDETGISSGHKGGKGGTVSEATLNLFSDGGNDIFLKGGAGGSSVKDAGGDGGAVINSRVKVLGILNNDVGADGGNGGSGGGAGPGGAGGAITNCTISATKFSNGGSHLFGGFGGAGAGNGGAGGAVTDGKISSAGSRAELSISGGGGGSAAAANSVAGAGGAVSCVLIKCADQALAGIYIYGGAGGNGNGSASGGDSGAISQATISAFSSAEMILIRTAGAGSGGNTGGSGGDSGSLTDIAITVPGFSQGAVRIFSGDGGGSSKGAGFHAGNSGSVTNASIKTLGFVDGSVEIYSGTGGGAGATSNNLGGSSGSVSDATIKTLGADGIVDILTGNGGAGGNAGGGNNGGSSGDLSGVSITTGGYITGGIVAGTGKAGNGRGVSGAANGGISGSVTGVKVINKAGCDVLEITSGAGGNTSAPDGNGGDSGSVSKLNVISLDGITNGANLNAGDGGDANGAAGSGGNGGSVSKLKVVDKAGATDLWNIFAGNGRDGSGTNAKLGGNGGDVTNFTFSGTNATLIVQAGLGGAGGEDAASKGGNGGSISGIQGSADLASFVAGGAGEANTGAGGAGGNIAQVNFKVARFARLIAAGDGGDVAAGGTAGVGGNVSDVKITGSGVIGDFTQDFEVMNGPTSGLGGLIAGQGGFINGAPSVGHNGTIDNVTATRIAAIIAGSGAGGSLTSSNAVKSITGLHASLIGADVDRDGVFDWNEGAGGIPGFQLQDSGTDGNDTALDGLVLVEAGGFTGKHPMPLLLIEV